MSNVLMMVGKGPDEDGNLKRPTIKSDPTEGVLTVSQHASGQLCEFSKNVGIKDTLQLILLICMSCAGLGRGVLA